jgi:hypothetical protein
MSNADIVRPTATVAAVEDTFLDRECLATGRPWLRLMPEVAGYGGLWFGELTALRARMCCSVASAASGNVCTLCAVTLIR